MLSLGCPQAIEYDGCLAMWGRALGGRGGTPVDRPTGHCKFAFALQIVHGLGCLRRGLHHGVQLLVYRAALVKHKTAAVVMRSIGFFKILQDATV